MGSQGLQFVRLGPVRVVDGRIETSQGFGETGVSSGAFFLMGLIHGHFPFQAEASGSHDAAGLEAGDLNTGIAIVVPFDRVIELLDRDDVRAEREADIAEWRAANPVGETEVEPETNEPSPPETHV